MITKIEEAIQYQFKMKNLIEQAMIHSSFVNENRMNPFDDNERLEFLGDAVLELTVSEYIFNTYPKLTEGEMTKLRASVVCEAMLSKKARELDLGSLIKMGKGEEQTGGRGRDSILCDVFESVIGAIYLDGGYEASNQFIMRSLQEEIKQMKQNSWMSDCKTFLQEQLQKNSKEPIEYNVVEEKGPDHEKIFVVELSHGSRTLSRGEGKNKKEAEQNAALHAIEKLNTHI